jgi:hypothetical protein
MHNSTMAEKHPSRPRDLNQWAKRMVDLGTMNEEELKALRAKIAEDDKPKKLRDKPHSPGKRSSSS